MELDRAGDADGDDVVDIDCDDEPVASTVTERMKRAAEEAEGDTETVGVVPAEALDVKVEKYTRYGLQ